MTRSSVLGRCEEKVQRDCEPPGNESPWAKASGIRVRRHTGLLPRVFTFPSRVGVGRANGGRMQAPTLGACREQAREHPLKALRSGTNSGGSQG